jgi:hypothetical protein
MQTFKRRNAHFLLLRKKPVSQLELNCTRINRLSHTCMKCHSSAMNRNGKCEEHGINVFGCCLRAPPILAGHSGVSDVF